MQGVSPGIDKVTVADLNSFTIKHNLIQNPERDIPKEGTLTCMSVFRYFSFIVIQISF